MVINILGQDYEVLLKSKEEYPKLELLDANGLAELYTKQLIINKELLETDDRMYDNIEQYNNKVVRHEIIHAFFHEAGLMNYCEDEKLVDWLAFQLPKMAKAVDGIDKLWKEG
jgi:hypothetical protein